MKSEEYKNKLKDILKDLTDNIDGIYYAMEKELKDETLESKEKVEKINEETNEIFNKLTHELCEKLIKNKLPFRVKLFNKIVWCGYAVEKSGYIKIYFTFNNDCDCFSYLFHITEIKEILKIKEGD